MAKIYAFRQFSTNNDLLLLPNNTGKLHEYIFESFFQLTC